jgi:hypothetical protein
VAQKTKIKKRGRVNWEAAMKFFVTNPEITYVDIAKKYGVSEPTARSHGSKGNWTGLRKQAQRKSEVVLVDNVADVLAETNEKHAKAYRMGQYYVNRRLQLALAKMQNTENKATSKVLLENGLEVPVVRDDWLMSPQQVNFLLSAMKTAMDGERVALGLPTNVTKSDNDLNINNPYAGYSEDQLRRIIEITDAELKSANTDEAELAS